MYSLPFCFLTFGLHFHFVSLLKTNILKMAQLNFFKVQQILFVLDVTNSCSTGNK